MNKILSFLVASSFAVSLYAEYQPSTCAYTIEKATKVYTEAIDCDLYQSAKEVLSKIWGAICP